MARTMKHQVVQTHVNMRNVIALCMKRHAESETNVVLNLCQRNPTGNDRGVQHRVDLHCQWPSMWLPSCR